MKPSKECPKCREIKLSSLNHFPEDIVLRSGFSVFKCTEHRKEASRRMAKKIWEYVRGSK